MNTDAAPDQQIVAVPRWHEYSHGYTRLGYLEVTGLKDRNNPATWPGSMNKAFYIGFLDDALSQRRAWMGESSYWGTTLCPQALATLLS